MKLFAWMDLAATGADLARRKRELEKKLA